MKEIFIGNYDLEQVGQTMTATGWVANIRNHGKLAFIELRDREGLLQVFVGGEIEDFVKLEEIGKEDLIAVTGQVVQREERFVNKALKSGQVELRAEKIEVIASSKALPFELDQHAHTGEDLRQKYRYLDLRREKMTHNLKLRHQVTSTIREYLNSLDFLEVETPYLTKSTPEGARDFLVPSRVFKNQFYALPQSPQMLKQLLMGAGLERYYQIVRCFRDEDLRGDRQPEFTQIDCEMSFVDQDDVINLFEEMARHLFREIRGVELPKLEQMKWHDAMKRYGSDKPDVRFGMEFVELMDDLKGTSEFSVFNEANYIGGIVVPNSADYSRKQLNELTDFVKRPQVGAKGLVYIKYDENGEAKSSVDKFFTQEQLQKVKETTGANNGDLVLILSGDNANKTRVQLCSLRLEMGNRLGLRDKNVFKCLWIVDFPLFEWSDEEQRLMATHHPFTMPKVEDVELLETAPEKAYAQAYDIVLNGYELGGGSIRIYDKEVQSSMFKALGFTQEQAQEQFGFLLDAFEYGVPPHGGCALGLDRFVMLLAGRDNLRDTIAFPKTANAADPMTQAPSPVDLEQLLELNIALLRK